MTNPQDNPQDMLSAFADGELTGEQNLEMHRRLGQDPKLAGQVEAQHKLKQSVARVMSDPSYQAPAELREAIQGLAGQTAADTTGDPAGRAQGSPVLAVIGRWVPAAVAAVLFIGALVVFSVNSNSPSAPAQAGANRLISHASLNTALVEKFGNRHTKCSRNLSMIHGTDKFPQELAKLPGALSDYFHQPIDPDVLDLSSLGLEFEVAGICILPGNGAVHLIYHTQNPTGMDEAMSLWMRPYEEGSGIEPDHLYATQASQETFPMIVWRHGDMVYYLVGDSYDTVEKAFEAIRKG